MLILFIYILSFLAAKTDLEALDEEHNIIEFGLIILGLLKPISDYRITASYPFSDPWMINSLYLSIFLPVILTLCDVLYWTGWNFGVLVYSFISFFAAVKSFLNVMLDRGADADIVDLVKESDAVVHSI